MIASELKMDW